MHVDYESMLNILLRHCQIMEITSVISGGNLWD